MFIFFSALKYKYPKINDKVKLYVALIYGLDDSNTSNKKNKLLLVLRILFSPLIIGVTIAFFLIWYLLALSAP